MDYVSARSDRANGAQQLHSAIDRHGVSVHGLRFRALWQDAALSALLHRGSDPDGAAYRQPHLAALFPLRTVRVGLAAADILEAPADAAAISARKKYDRDGSRFLSYRGLTLCCRSN